MNLKNQWPRASAAFKPLADDAGEKLMTSCSKVITERQLRMCVEASRE